jgi:hypothetical protein
MSTKHTQTNWPESTCAQCGRKMPSGLMQDCFEGGWCTWAIPEAYREHMTQEVQRLREEIRVLKSSIDIRLNNRLIEMKPEWDDSITGFNEAWDIVRKAFADRAALQPSPRKVDGQ